ncbi:Tetratricopeptide repeat protein [compost metagenome]
MDGEREIQKAYESILGHDFDKAIEWFQKAIAAEPDNAAYHYKLSITYARSNKLQKAVEHANRAIELVGDTRVDYRYHLQTLHARELIVAAEKCFAEPHLRMGEAVVLLKEAIVLDPLAVEAYLILGAAYANLGDYRSAWRAAQDGVRMDPQNDLAKQQLLLYEQKLKS